MFTKVQEARIYAIKKHGSQEYGDGVPYFHHLDDTVDVLIEHGFVDEKYLIGGYLHDTIEDTEATYNKLKELFGVEVAEMVFSVTDPLGTYKNRKDKKRFVYSKIRKNVDGAVLKLADRIANVRRSVKMKSKQLKMYLKEHDSFMTGISTVENTKTCFKLYETYLKLIEEIAKNYGKEKNE